MRKAALFLALSLPFLALANLARADTAGDCHIGAYRLADGQALALGASDGDKLRWRRFDGEIGALHPQANGGWVNTAGWSDRPDGHKITLGPCGSGEMSFDGQPAKRLDFDVIDTSFAGKGVTLRGRLLLPKGTGPVPIVVLVHGSEHYSGVDIYPWQYLLPAEGIGVFVYDKRGTGKSTGHYTQDFPTLADDAVAALDEARRLAGARTGRAGFQGGSQGGWVAPLASLKTHVDFVVVSFGLAINPLEEDQQQVALEMALKGHSPEEIKKAEEVAAAAGEIMTSNLTRGFEHFDAVRAKYRNEPWYKDLHGNFTGDLLPFDKKGLLDHKDELLMGTPWHYDSMAALRKVTVPELWILGGNDLAAPSAETSHRILSLADQGKPFTLALFPTAEHGIYEYEMDPSGERVDLRNSDGYFAMMRDFIRDGKLSGPYGDAAIVAKGDVKKIR